MRASTCMCTPGLGATLFDLSYACFVLSLVFIPYCCSVMEADMLLYSHAMQIFKNQTAEVLGSVWAE